MPIFSKSDIPVPSNFQRAELSSDGQVLAVVTENEILFYDDEGNRLWNSLAIKAEVIRWHDYSNLLFVVSEAKIEIVRIN